MSSPIFILHFANVLCITTSTPRAGDHLALYTEVVAVTNALFTDAEVLPPKLQHPTSTEATEVQRTAS